MFLKRITLHDFKCLQDIDLSFKGTTNTANRKWTLVLGENGTGKSNLLKAIALITGGSNAMGELLGDANSWIRKGQNKCTVSATISTKEGKERELKLEIVKDSTLFEMISLNNRSLQLIDDAIENADRNYFVVAFGASRRLATESFSTPEKSSNKRYFNVRNLFFNQYPLNPLTSWVMELDYRTGDKGLQIVKDTLNDFLPGTTFYGVDKEKKQILFETADGIMPLGQLSDGYQNMAAWIGDLLYRITESFRDYEKPMEARGLLLIDEIDLHLHPRWQRMLIDFISKKLPNFQVVATTHSPLTAQQADEGELFALKRHAQGPITLEAFQGSPKKLLINQLLMTPIFGLETDESLEVEQIKNRYDQLNAQQNLSPNEQKDFDSIKRELKKKLPKRAATVPSPADISLLEKIQKELKIQKSK